MGWKLKIGHRHLEGRGEGTIRWYIKPNIYWAQVISAKTNKTCRYWPVSYVLNLTIGLDGKWGLHTKLYRVAFSKIKFFIRAKWISFAFLKKKDHFGEHKFNFSKVLNFVKASFWLWLNFEKFIIRLGNINISFQKVRH